MPHGDPFPIGPASTADALALFDSLDPVDAASMLGAWTGAGFPTGHPLDGALEACRWQGKRFDGPEDVHPLLFARRGGGTLAAHPRWLWPALPLVQRVPALKSPAAGRIARLLLPLLATRRSRGRLRMTLHRGVVTATLVYDDVPILDVFRRLDADRLLGLMDCKGVAQPFFFTLRRALAHNPGP